MLMDEMERSGLPSTISAGAMGEAREGTKTKGAAQMTAVAVAIRRNLRLVRVFIGRSLALGPERRVPVRSSPQDFGIGRFCPSSPRAT